MLKKIDKITINNVFLLIDLQQLNTQYKKVQRIKNKIYQKETISIFQLK